MNLKDIRDYVRSFCENMYHAGKMSDNKQFTLEDKMIDIFINEGYRFFCVTARTNKKIGTVTTIANTQEYDLPVGLSQIINVFYSSATDKWKLHQIRDDEQLWWELQSNNVSSAYSTQYGQNKINLYPQPAQSGEIVSIYGSFIPDDMVNDGETPLIPERYHQALVDYALFRTQQMIGLIDQTQTSAQQQFASFRQLFETQADQCRKETEFTGNEFLQFRDGTEWDDNEYQYPHFDHNPVMGIVQYSSNLYFKNTVNGEYINGYEDLSPITITSDDFDYAYTATQGLHYEIFCYAERSTEAVAVLSLDVEHWPTAFTTLAPAKTIKIDRKAKTTGNDILISVTTTAGSATVTINVKNANGGTLNLKIRNKITL